MAGGGTITIFPSLITENFCCNCAITPNSCSDFSLRSSQGWSWMKKAPLLDLVEKLMELRPPMAV